MQLDIHTTRAVLRSAFWAVWKPTIAVAQGTTEDGRTVVGIGSSRVSESSALDAAVENAKTNAQKYRDFSFTFSEIQDPSLGERIVFLAEKGEIRRTGNTEGVRLSVEVFAEQDGREVTARGKPGMTDWEFGFGYDTALQNALDDVESQLSRVGTTTV